jgi:N-acetylglucosamine repressor
VDGFSAGNQQGRNIQDVKSDNRSLVFEHVRSSGGISRAELARRTGLTPSTVTNIVKELIRMGLIKESGFLPSSGGRRPSCLQINAQWGFLVGVYLARSWISARLTDLNLGTAVSRRTESSSLSEPVEITVPALLTMIRDLISDADVPRDRIIGIGICAPGPLDPREGVFTTVPNFPGWNDVPLARIVEEETGVRTILDNDATASALAEKWFGVAQEMDTFVYVLADTGVGGGIVIDGELYHGQHDIGGEIGHTTVDLHGRRCGCGNVGCLELYAAPQAIVSQVRETVLAGRESLVEQWGGEDLDTLNFEMIVRAARQGDVVALDAIRGMSQALAVGVINLMHSLDPEAILIGGQAGLAGDLLFDTIEAVVRERCLSKESREISILPSQLGAEAPITGALCLVLREVFRDPQIWLMSHFTDR